MKHNVYIFGEMHTKTDRDRVEDEIRKLHKSGKLKFLLSEELGNLKAFTDIEKKSGIKNKQFSISDRSYHLGVELGIPVIGIDSWDDRTYARDKKKSNGEYLDCSESFKIRENKMVATINEFGNLGNCAVIVGDSHLRGLPNAVMGDVSPIQKAYLNDPKVKIHRSPVSELKEHGVVRVSGDSFNPYVYKRMVDLGNFLLMDEVQYENLGQRTRMGMVNLPYKKDDFTFPDKYTFCKVVDNEIVSIVQAFFSTKTYIWLGPIFTDEGHRGNGYIGEIFNHLFLQYPKDKYGFGLNVLAGNIAAKKLYEKLGFKSDLITMKL